MNKNISDLLDRIRPEVRREAAYSVSSYGSVQVKINQNENPYSIPLDLKEDILSEIAKLDWNRYPDRFGEDLREAVTKDLGIDKESILLGNGSNELVYLLAQSLLDSDSKVLLPDPMFSLYEKAVRLRNAKVVEIPCDENFDIKVMEFGDLIDEEKPDLIILTSPNNPTGSIIPLEVIKLALEKCDGFVILDEAYFEFLEGNDGLCLLKEYPNLIILRTFSKVLGLAGVRLGYILGRPAIIKELFKLRLPFMIDRISSTIGIRILQEKDLIKERLEILLSERKFVKASLDKLSEIEQIESGANFILFKSPMESAQLVKAMAEKGVLIRDMSGYSKLKNYVRVSIGTPDENKIFVKALTECGLN